MLELQDSRFRKDWSKVVMRSISQAGIHSMALPDCDIVKNLVGGEFCHRLPAVKVQRGVRREIMHSALLVKPEKLMQFASALGTSASTSMKWAHLCFLC